MRLLAVDIGTGTQDILLYDTRLQPENAFKIVAPSPTMMVARRVREATRHALPLVIRGRTMGGGPSHWAVRDHAAAGLPVYISAEAARSFDDDLERVQREMALTLISEDEAAGLSRSHPGWLHLEFLDFDYRAIAEAFRQFGLDVVPDGVALAVFDHGEAPPDISDRQFRFDFLQERLLERPRPTAFAFAAESIPPRLTRMAAAVRGAHGSGMPDVPVMVMDTAPAAICGALLDSQVKAHDSLLMTNLGNFHTLAFRLAGGRVEGLFEHHTGMLNAGKLDGLLDRLADGTLRHEDVFNDHGHGALLLNPQPVTPERLVVTGPRRSMAGESHYPLINAAPFGDMMLAGCYGLLAAWAEVFPGDQEVLDSLFRNTPVTPWELL